MNIINNNMKWIMLVAGVFTCTMLLAFISPNTAMQNTFGEFLNSPLANMIVRSWGFLIFLLGLMLIYGAYKLVYRKLILAVVGTSKLVFVILVIAYGYSQPALLPILFDSTVVVLSLIYLLTAPKETA